MDDDVGRGPIGAHDDRGSGKGFGGLLGSGQSPVPLDTSKAKPAPKPAPIPAPLNSPRLTTDVSDADRQKVIRFSEFQATQNLAGIGNECLHFILAAEFEIRSLETDASLIWGRALTPATTADTGDIAQYKGHIGDFLLYTKKYGTIPYQKKRGPDHTGVLTRPPKNGIITNWEAHLHDQLDPSFAVMQVRRGTAYYESFYIKVPVDIADPAAQQAAKNLDTEISDDYLADKSRLMGIPFGDARRFFEITAAEGAQIEVLVRARTPPPDVAVFFHAKVTGTVTFYRLQQDASRAGELPDAAATDKDRLVKLMKQTGRAGDSVGSDPYGGDNKIARINPTDRFTWTYSDNPPKP